MLTDDDLDPFPISADLPISADIEINRTFVERFSAAKRYEQPEFWFGKAFTARKNPGRPSIMHLIFPELERRAEAGVLEDAVRPNRGTSAAPHGGRNAPPEIGSWEMGARRPRTPMRGRRSFDWTSRAKEALLWCNGPEGCASGPPAPPD